MIRYNLKANAKLNLYININFKNANNYHDLTMLNIPINLYDSINLIIDSNKADEIKISANSSDVPTNENNLIYQVVQHFKKINNLQFFLDVKLFKEIPTKSGTGGASSDAAVIIKKLYEHFKLPISKERLVKIYTPFGADIAFFFYNTNAIVNGIGDKITPINLNLKRYYFVLIHPSFKQSTIGVYKMLNEVTKIPDNNRIHEAIEQIKTNQNFNLLKNDFMQVIKNVNYDKIIKELYDQGAKFVNVTGTGSTVFAIMPKEINAKNLNNTLQKTYKNVFICQNIGENNE